MSYMNGLSKCPYSKKSPLSPKYPGSVACIIKFVNSFLVNNTRFWLNHSHQINDLKFESDLKGLSNNRNAYENNPLIAYLNINSFARNRNRRVSKLQGSRRNGFCSRGHYCGGNKKIWNEKFTLWYQWLCGSRRANYIL